jgi:AmmeMemoRadiSam system protein B
MLDVPASHPDFRPCLRRQVRLTRAAGVVGYHVLHDPYRIAAEPLIVDSRAEPLLRALDGSRSVAELAPVAGRFGVRSEQLAQLVAALDENLYLDGPTYRAVLTGPVRRPICTPVYGETPEAVRRAAEPLFTGSGRPAGAAADGRRLRAVLVPHMDFARGGVTYGWGFKELAERTADVDVFVIVATSHYSSHRFTLTRQHFRTPLGDAQTDRAYTDRLVSLYGDGLFDDPLAHFPEHSVELEVVLLQYVRGDRPFTIVPLLVGSFHDRVAAGSDPGGAPDIARMLKALRQAEAADGRRVCYVISGDLAHIGPKFHRPDVGPRFHSDQPVREPWLGESKRRDDQLLDRLTAADPAGYFEVIAAEGDERNVCGFPPTWLTLAAVRPRSGKVLHYGRAVDPNGRESVSFASAAFYE